MTSRTAFGPQGQNAVTALPPGGAANRYGVGVDTWCKGCNDAGGATVLGPEFFNMIIGNLRTLCAGAVADGAGFSLSDGDMTLLQKAVQFYAGDGVAPGDGLKQVGSLMSIDVPGMKEMTA